MDRNPPPRRWYQFRLSTILVLVAIAAWAMSIQFFIPTGRRVYLSEGHPGLVWEETSLNPLLAMPAFAFCALLIWKAALSIIGRRRQ